MRKVFATTLIVGIISVAAILLSIALPASGQSVGARPATVYNPRFTGTVTAPSFVATAASGVAACTLTQGARIYFNATDYLYHDGTYIRSNVGIQAVSMVIGTGSSGLQVAGGGGALLIAGKPTDAAGAYALDLISYVTLTSLDALIARYRNNSGTVVSGVQKDGKYMMQATDSSGTPGAATINKPSGQSAIAASASSVVITNSTVLTTSIVLGQLQANDGTCTSIQSIVPAAGSFTVTVNAACTGNTKLGWVVFN